MSSYKINQNQDLSKLIINNEKVSSQNYYKENTDSVRLLFEEELKNKGFVYEVPSQIHGFLPKHKGVILPLALQYYEIAKSYGQNKEMEYFLSFFRYKECENIIPILIEDYHKPNMSDDIRWAISDCIYSIKSKKYVDEYLQIITNPAYGISRQMIVLLMGKLKSEKSIPILIELLEDESVRLHAICALGDFKNEAFRTYFERFSNDKHPGWRKYAKEALKKLSK